MSGGGCVTKRHRACREYRRDNVVCSFGFLSQAEDGIRVLVRSRGLGDVYKRQLDIRLKILDKSIGKGDIRLCRNAFPYLKLIQHLDGVVHYCLWSRIGKLSPKTIEAKIKSKFPGKDFFWFENSPTTKSIPQVWHCQVFIKLK